MIAGDLERITPPEPVARPACESCRCMAREVRVPVEPKPGEPDTRGLCWGCAHAVCEHGATWEHAYAVFGADCKCGAESVYPPDVRARRPLEPTSGTINVRDLESSPVEVAPARTALRAARDMRRQLHHGRQGSR